MSNGMCYHYSFQTAGRFPFQPKGGWKLVAGTLWEREASDENIEFDLGRAARVWAARDGAVIVKWRRLSSEEHQLFSQDRPGWGSVYRNALVDFGGKIVHDLPKARELHRGFLRKLRAAALPELDGQWMRAQGQNRKAEAEAIEAERQRWRDAPNNPNIETATTIDELKLIGV
jgi:hypothetical protein